MTVREAFIYIVRQDMADLDISPLELYERIDVLADTEHFKAGEDESVWLQKKGKAPNYYEVYFDLVWVCDFTESEQSEVVRHRFLKNFLKLYEAKEIRLTRGLAKQIREAEEAKKKADAEAALKALPETTSEEKAAKDIVTELIKEEHATPARHNKA